MIGESLYTLLSNYQPLTELVENRVYSIAFRQAGTFPSVAYNVKNERPLFCRDPKSTRTGRMEVQVLANDEVELETIMNRLLSLDGYDGTVGGYAITLELSPEEIDFDEDVEDLTAFFKAIPFDFYATKLN